MTKQKVDPYTENAEVTKQGVRPKGTRAPPNKGGTIKVTHRTERRGKFWLRTFVAGTLIADMVWGMSGIYLGIEDPEWRIHALWAFGISHVTALAVVWFNKLE